MTLKCYQVDVLKLFLSKIEHTLENKPNGQSMYTFPNGLVLNVYETGSVVFQGNDSNNILKPQIENFIAHVNAPFAS